MAGETAKRPGAEPRSGFSLKALLPWQAKIAAKLVLSRLPVGYGLWRRLAIFQHGDMSRPEYAYAVFKEHFDRTGFSSRRGGFVAMEIGPGDSLFSALIASAFGATAVHLADAGTFARQDMKCYRAMYDYLRAQGLPAPDISECDSLADILAVCNARYLTSGLTSLQELPSKSIDFIWSQAVLEHIRRCEFLNFARQMRRVLREDGVCSHRIDLMDHLGGALNNLRFSERLWESDFMARSGFYTNRLRHSEMLALFEQAGFTVEVVHVDRWPQLPTPKHKLADKFNRFSDDELCVSGFDVMLRPA